MLGGDDIKSHKTFKANAYALFFTLVFVSLSTTSLFAEDFSIPSMCLDRAVEQNILIGVPKQNIKAALSAETPKTYNYQVLRENLHQSLEKLNQDLTIGSDLFSYLANCSNDPTLCVGYFNPSNESHRNLFCDKELLRVALEGTITYQNTLMYRCGESAELFFKSPLEQDVNYLKQCFTTQTDTHGQIKKTHIAQKYSQEKAWLSTWTSLFYSEIKQAIEQAQYPDAMLFVLAKISEEFGLRSSPQKDIFIQQINYAAFIHALLWDDKAKGPYEGKYETAHQYINIATKSLIEQDGRIGLFFRPESAKTSHALQKHVNTLQYLNDPRRKTSPLQAGPQLRFANFLSPDVPATQSDEKKILKGFLPYQFMRVAKAKVFRELQQHTKAKVDALIKSTDANGLSYYYDWVDNRVCLGNTSRFCSQTLKNFRYKYYKKWLEQIEEGNIELDFQTSDYNESWREYIYDSAFLATLNQKLTAINKYCWLHAVDPSTYSNVNNKIKLLKEKAPTLDLLIQDLFQTPRFAELLENPEFIKVLQYRTGEKKYDTCFSQGYVFGSEPRKTSSFYQHVEYYSPLPGVTIDKSSSLNLITRPYEKFNEPKIQISLQQLNLVEKDIERLIQMEFNTVIVADKYETPEEIHNFLEKSAPVRIFALLEYSIDHPSQAVGALIRSMLRKGNQDEISWQKTQHTLMTLVIVASIATAFVVPSSLIIIYRLGTALVTFTSGAYISISAERHYQKDLQAIAGAAVSDNILSSDAADLQSFLLKKVQDNRVLGLLYSSLSIATELVIVGRGITQMRYLWSRDMRKIYFKRMNELEKLQRALSEVDPQTGKVVSIKWLPYEFKVFLSNVAHVGTELYDDFIRAALKGEGPEFISSRPILAAKHASIDTSNHVILLFRPIIWTSQQLLKGFQWGLDFIFARTYLQKIKHLFISSLYRFARRDIVSHQVFIDTVNYSLKKKHISLAQVEEYLKDMPLYEIKNGFLSWKITEVRLAQADQFIDIILQNNLSTLLKNKKITSELIKTFEEHLPDLKIDPKKLSVSWDSGKANVGELLKTEIFKQNSLDQIIQYLNPVIKGNILDDDQWIRVFQRFKRPITSVRDCKAFLKTIKFIVREDRFRKQFSDLSTDVVGLFLLKKPQPKGYVKIVNTLIDNIDDIYDTAKYIQYDNFIKFSEYAIQYTKRYPNISLQQMDEAIKLVDDDYELLKNIGDIPALRALRDAYKPSSTIVENIAIAEHQAAMIKNEIEINSFFYKRLNQELSKRPHIDDFAEAYDRALFRTWHKKMLNTECYLPNSVIKKEPDRLFKNFSQYISTITNVYGYLQNHPPSKDGIDLEFMTRLIYEVIIPPIGQGLKAKGFINAKTIPAKALSDWQTGTTVGLGVMPFYTLFNELFWDSDNIYEAKIRAEIYNTDNPQKKLAELFIRHPEIQAQVNQRIELLKKTWNAFFEELDEKMNATDLSKKIDLSNPDVQAQEAGRLYDAFLKAGLIDSYDGDIDKVNGNESVHDTLEEVFYYNAFDAVKSSSIKWALFGHNIEVTPDFTPMQFKTRRFLLVPDFMAESVDRFTFYATYDLLVDSPMTIIRQHAIRKTLCSLRQMPPIIGVGAGALIYAAYKIAYDPFRYWVRKEATGH